MLNLQVVQSIYLYDNEKVISCSVKNYTYIKKYTLL